MNYELFEKSYTYDDVENKVIDYDQYIISRALDKIAIKNNWLRHECLTKCFNFYGGDLQMTIIMGLLNCE